MSDRHGTKCLLRKERIASKDTKRIDLTGATSNAAQQFHDQSATVIVGLLCILELHSRPAF
jgi:hypothetical protein